MLGGGTQKSLRKALGAIKDSTIVNLAKVNSSDYKELDIAIVKFTNHVERPAKEKHIRAIFAAISAMRPRADVAYCIHALARQLSKTHNWAYMSLPASQYSVLDAESIERVDNSTFRCYVYNFKFFAFEVCPVLLVRVEEKPNGFCIKLLSCKLEDSPIVVAQNKKIDASMVNRVSCDRKQSDSSVAELTSDTVIEVSIEIPFAFRPIPVQAIESSSTQVLEQILRIMLPCFMAQILPQIAAALSPTIPFSKSVRCLGASNSDKVLANSRKKGLM
ncbi:putative clathrin assembly protein [Camellia lanceoleosa]|uniref:Clathrin assembly protein n=1 Tax=Camellia lanceoleosa TaxID=1840588 RepID=A0ACC0IW21_9ERIC|nr:putative clathrin assembly protein [Camellia lanceoleosa]